MEVNRRTQADRTAATRAALITAARVLISEQGFSAVGTQAIAAAAGVTRGALYHQFADKAELFMAVFEEIEEELLAQIGDAMTEAAITDPIAALELGARRWLELCADPQVHRIVLIEAPVVLGWDQWREIGQRYALGMVEALIAQAVSTGAVPAQPVRPLAHVMIGAIDEAALYVSRSDEPEKARAEMLDVVRRLIQAMTIEL
ncbi:TetR family transcriptional regulator [Williamsia limnetica]|jgi:AcrR family transcriptional regulator|uniref:TetR family transcriptional regulator n=1 Tax=Williamsia limnetica TaxID=882452 RepID=A0A318RJ32_WILLI|nr:TetR/AcrR family transcriptional regulator [Williamsia limnetica]PYE15036.1 TetR family transcriptional regulator [Williamsia limnetica]